MKTNEVKLMHTDEYNIVRLECNGNFLGLFTNQEANGVIRAFQSLKSNSESSDLNIVFESMTKEELSQREIVR